MSEQKLLPMCVNPGAGSWAWVPMDKIMSYSEDEVFGYFASSSISDGFWHRPDPHFSLGAAPLHYWAEFYGIF